MKNNSIAWEKTKKRTLFFLWPMAISTVLSMLVTPLITGAPKLLLLMPLLSLIVFLPFIFVDARRQRAETAREKRALQAKYDAEESDIW